MNTIFITSRLDKDHGGLTASLLNKARILHDYKGIKSKILSFHADQNFSNLKNEIKNRYSLENKAKILNINDYYRNRGLQSSKTKYSIDTSKLIPVSINGNVKEFYKNGIKILEIIYANGSIKEVKHFAENSLCIKKDIIDKEGYLYWTSHYYNNNLSRQIFFRKDGIAFQTREYESTNNKNSIKNIVLFDNSVVRFNSFDNFKKYFIEEFITENPTYLIGEARGQDSVIMNIQDNRVRKVFMIHSIHMRPDTDIIRTGNKMVLNNLNEIDALILLTEKQKEDITNQFGGRNNYYVIPHSIEIPNLTEIKDNNNIVIISRLHEEKRLDHAIKAFQKVVKEKPEAQLFIYGDGEQKGVLQNLINELRLKESVKLMGYANNTYEILQNATCSLLTSKYEGFALVIQESIANGTPVIAYDIKYGPSDMIESGKNGFLVEEGNIDKLATSIIKYLNTSKKEKQNFSELSIEKAQLFSNERFATSWVTLFEKLKLPKVKIKPNVKLKKIDRKFMSKNNFKIEVEVKINNHKNSITPVFWGTFYNRSTLNNDGVKKRKQVEGIIKERKDDLYQIEFLFKSNEYEVNDIYDVFLSMKYDSYYFDLRVGNQRSPINIENYKTKKVIPYFTNKYDNLSFKL